MIQIRDRNPTNLITKLFGLLNPKPLFRAEECHKVEGTILCFVRRPKISDSDTNLTYETEQETVGGFKGFYALVEEDVKISICKVPFKLNTFSVKLSSLEEEHTLSDVDYYNIRTFLEEPPNTQEPIISVFDIPHLYLGIEKEFMLNRETCSQLNDIVDEMLIRGVSVKLVTDCRGAN